MKSEDSSSRSEGGWVAKNGRAVARGPPAVRHSQRMGNRFTIWARKNMKIVEFVFFSLCLNWNGGFNRQLPLLGFLNIMS